MSENDATKSKSKPVSQAARDYVKAQIKLMRQHGHSAKLSREQINQLVAKVERATTG